MPRIIRLDSLQQFTAINVLTDPGAGSGPVVIPDACKVMIVWNLSSGNVGRNVLYGRVSGSFTPTPAMAESIRVALTTGAPWAGLAGFLAPTAALAAVELQDVRNAGLPVVRSTGAAAAGTSSGIALPDETAVCVTLRTDRVGPGHRGRFYLPGWATNALGTANVIAPGVITAVATWTAIIPNAFTAQGLTWALGLPARVAYTGSTGTQHPARAAQTELVIGFGAIDNHWDSQRRRGLK